MGIILWLIVLYVLWALARSVKPALALTNKKMHQREHPDHRIETYVTPRGATIWHCWGVSGQPVCGERWKVREGVRIPSGMAE